MPALPPAVIEKTFQQGKAAHGQGKLDLARAFYSQVLAQQPRHAGALQMVGVIHFQNQQYEEAAPLLRKAVTLSPKDASAHNNLGNVLLELKDMKGAIAAFSAAVKLSPRNPEFFAGMGRALRAANELDAAVGAYDMAISLEPKRARFYAARGEVLLRLERFEEAATDYRRVEGLGTKDRKSLADAAAGLREARCPEESLALYERALKLFPADPELHVGLAYTYQALGRYAEMVPELRLARTLGATGSNFENALMFRLNHALETDPIEGRADAQEFFRRVHGKVVPATQWPNSRDIDRRLRIGLVSPDFRQHPVGRFMAHSLPAINRERFELFAYSEVEVPEDPIRQALGEAIPHWRTTKDLSTDEVVAHIAADEIDILIDLAGYTANNRLPVFARKPAPVSVSWLGFFATTGFPTIDYVLCNRWLIPPEEEAQWIEKPWFLPEAHWCLAKPDPLPEVMPAPALGRDAVVTFGGYNNFEKISPATVALWAKVLQAVPNSRLKLRYHLKTDETAKRLHAAFIAAGIAEDRLDIVNQRFGYAEHLKSYGELDIALDPFPYNGGTTTAEALIMGVPVLTLRGDRFVSHLAETNIQAIGAGDWVAADEAAYVEIAKKWAANPVALNALRGDLRARCLASKLFDAERFAVDLEEAFRGMWRNWCLANPA